MSWQDGGKAASNHAILRYQERVARVSQEAAREVLEAPEVLDAIAQGHQYFTLASGNRAVIKGGRIVTVLPVVADLSPCPFCGTAMLQHKTCFSHPQPAGGDCILRHYSFDNQKARDWNRRSEGCAQ